MSNIILGDCLEVMRGFVDNQFDLILTDPPYGITQNTWDSYIDFMSEAFRVTDTIVMTAVQPYAAKVIYEYRKYFKYELIWEKTVATGFLNAKKQPLRAHENILVFSKGKPLYIPQKTSGHLPVHSFTKHSTDGTNYGKTRLGISGGGATERYPRSVLLFSSDKQSSHLHPTQKPLELMRYLVKTYSREGDTILDPFCGSGTTLLAARQLNRDYVGIDINPDYINIARERLKQEILL